MEKTSAPPRQRESYFLSQVLKIGLVFLLSGASSGFAIDVRPRAPVIKPGRTKIGPAVCTNVITVKFQDGLKIRAWQGKLHFDEPRLLPLKQGTLKNLEKGRWERMDKLPEEQIEAMRQKAQRKLSRAIADLNTDFYFFLPNGMDVASVIDSLNALEAVELAQPVPRPTPAPLPPDFLDDQLYLDAGPMGIDAFGAWNDYGTKGGGIRVADLEYEFNESHQDLPTIQLLGPTPGNAGFGNDHGTAVLGELFSLPNGWGTTGIIPEAAPYFVGTYDGNVWDVGSAVSTALGTLQAGDVLLIEQQYGGPRYTNYPSQSGLIPVEWYKPWYDRIVTAVGLGVIVVEAAGNGSQNLDDAIYSTGNGGHWPFRPENDSGAIIVGAGTSFYSSPSQARISYSNYGSTVDLQGWGEFVSTTGYGYAYSEEGANYYYTYAFSGTSSATPIVAGACALIQSAYKSRVGNVLSPAAVKQALRATGSPQQGNSAQNIGPFPNVSAALASVLPSAPLRLSNVSVNGGLLHFVLTGSAGDYLIEISTNLVNWSPVSTNTIPASGSVDVFDASSSNQPARFYRARTLN